ncbi:MAG: vitamin K epoxide reductase family protein [Caldilineales bacterium]|nr:vitamin K epoxide reductase family protein [Caldilineales bacterium]
MARRRIIVFLSLLGIFIAGYLSWVKFSDTQAFCGGVGDCSSVQNSAYAYLFGIPVAYLGLLNYIALFAASLFNLRAGPELRSWGELAVFALAVLGFAFSAYLTYTELFQIHAICPWCVASFVNLTAIMILAAIPIFGGEPESEAAYG